MAATFSGLPQCGSSSLGTAPHLWILPTPISTPFSQSAWPTPRNSEPPTQSISGVYSLLPQEWSKPPLSSSTPKQWLPSLINSTQHIAVRAILVRLRSDPFTPLLQTLPQFPITFGRKRRIFLPRCGGTTVIHRGRSRKEKVVAVLSCKAGVTYSMAPGLLWDIA